MSSIAGNHAIDLFYLLKKNFKNLIIWLIDHDKEPRYYLIYQVVRCHKDGDSEENAWTYYKTLNQTVLTWKNRESSLNAFYGLEACDTHLAVACLRIGEFFISNFKINIYFLSITVQLSVADNHIS